MKKISLFITLVLTFSLCLPQLTMAGGTGQLNAHNTLINGINRSYLVYRPTTCVTKACPVLLMFHQLGATANDAANNYGWQETADKNEFIAVFPESLIIPKKDIKLGNTVIYPGYDVEGKHWDIANVSLPLDQRYTTQDVEFVKTILNDLPKNYQILNSHIFSTGHSYGAFFSYYLSVCLPDKITAFAEHSGGYVSFAGAYSFAIPARDAKANPDFNVPGLLLNSTGDNIVPYSWAQALQTELQTKGYTNEFVTLDAGLGHGWDISKNQKQWDFFLAHSPAIPKPPVKVNFASINSTAAENGAGIDVKISLDAASSDPIKVNIAPTANSSATLNADYTVNPNAVTFAPGEKEKTIKLTPLADALYEPDEKAELALTIASGNAILGANALHTFTIIDKTPSVIEFVSTSSTVNEYLNSSVTVVPTEVKLKLTGKGTEPIQIKIEVDPISTASAGIDFNLSTDTLQFNVNEFEKTFTVNVITDKIKEPDETIVLRAKVISGNAVIGANSAYTATIHDNHVPLDLKVGIEKKAPQISKKPSAFPPMPNFSKKP